MQQPTYLDPRLLTSHEYPQTMPSAYQENGTSTQLTDVIDGSLMHTASDGAFDQMGNDEPLGGLTFAPQPTRYPTQTHSLGSLTLPSYQTARQAFPPKSIPSPSIVGPVQRPQMSNLVAFPQQSLLDPNDWDQMLQQDQGNGFGVSDSDNQFLADSITTLDASDPANAGFEAGTQGYDIFSPFDPSAFDKAGAAGASFNYDSHLHGPTLDDMQSGFEDAYSSVYPPLLSHDSAFDQQLPALDQQFSAFNPEFLDLAVPQQLANRYAMSSPGPFPLPSGETLSPLFGLANDNVNTPDAVQSAPPTSTSSSTSTTVGVVNTNSQALVRNGAQRDTSKDNLLVSLKSQGLSYKRIKVVGNFAEAESTLRGRYRALTKPREARVRKPEWGAREVQLLCQAVASCSKGNNARPPAGGDAVAVGHWLNKVPWKQVAEYMEGRGTYRYGNATVKKKYLEVLQGQGVAVA